MIEPVATQDLMAAAIAGAMIVLFGALYALFFALARLQNKTSYMVTAYAAYALLVLAVAVLMRTLNMTGIWQLVAAVMVIGYFVLPRVVWRLCVETHEAEHTVKSELNLSRGGN